MFKVGDRVAWQNPILHQIKIGTVLDIIACDSNHSDFAQYDVNFAFGMMTLHGSELRAVVVKILSCDENERLQIAFNTALTRYTRLTTQLADAAGMIAHTEFEFLAKKVQKTHQLLAEARKRLAQHIAEHEC